MCKGPGVIILLLSVVLMVMAFAIAMPMAFKVILGMVAMIFFVAQIKIWRWNSNQEKKRRENEK